MSEKQDEVVRQAEEAAVPLLCQPADATDSGAPPWMQDFPVETVEDNYVARRDFTKFMVLTSGAFAVGQAWIGIKTIVSEREHQPAEKMIGRVDEVQVGQARGFSYPGENDPCLLLRLSETEFVAYSQKCTHLSCAVVPGGDGTLRCPCHEGSFDCLSGRPLAGPPRRPLPRITLQVRAEVIYATGVEARMA